MAREKKVNVYEHYRKIEREKDIQQIKLKKNLIDSKEVIVSIPPIYARRIGQNLPVTVGTETISIPVDGRSYRIKQPFAIIIKNHLAQIDKEDLRSKGTFQGMTGDVSATGDLPK